MESRFLVAARIVMSRAAMASTALAMRLRAPQCATKNKHLSDKGCLDRNHVKSREVGSDVISADLCGGDDYISVGLIAARPFPSTKARVGDLGFPC